MQNNFNWFTINIFNLLSKCAGGFYLEVIYTIKILKLVWMFI